jgi:hypothetical protein
VLTCSGGVAMEKQCVGFNVDTLLVHGVLTLLSQEVLTRSNTSSRELLTHGLC